MGSPRPVRLLPVILVCLALLAGGASGHAAEPRLKVLASTFPVFQITRNVTRDAAAIEVELMIPASLGCPHDYALTPQDMRKLAAADVLVINGLGLEEFLGAPVNKANPRLVVIDSSRGIEEVLHYGETEEHAEEAEHHDHRDDDHDHGQGQVNPHLFASPRMAALMAGTIGQALAERHPAEAALLTANAKAYAERMRRLTDDMAAVSGRLANNRIVTQHGVFDYLARDLGLVVVAVVQAHAGQDPSAAEILALVKTIRATKAGAIFTEPQYPQALGKTIAHEAGIVAATLDPAANGPEQAPLAYYEQVMRTNMTVLEQALGSH